MERKVILITGASRGIGRAIALTFANHGYDVIINCSKSAEALAGLEAEIKAFGVRCLACIGDVGNPEFVESMFHSIRQEFGRLDILVNNAGISYVGLLTDMTPADWKRVIDTNLSSVFSSNEVSAGLVPAPQNQSELALFFPSFARCSLIG